LLLRVGGVDVRVGVFVLRRTELLRLGEYAFVDLDRLEGFTELPELFTGLLELFTGLLRVARYDFELREGDAVDRVDRDADALLAGAALERGDVVLREAALELDREEEGCPFTDCLELLDDAFARPDRDWASASAANQQKARVMAHKNRILRHMIIPPTMEGEESPDQAILNLRLTLRL
jgi:hypothetical protein